MDVYVRREVKPYTLVVKVYRTDGRLDGRYPFRPETHEVKVRGDWMAVLDNPNPRKPRTYVFNDVLEMDSLA